MNEYRYYYRNNEFVLMENGEEIYKEVIDEPQNIEDTINELSEEGIIPCDCIAIRVF